MSRKKTEINWKFVNDNLKDLCDGTEIAAALGITEDTLYNRVKEKFHMDFSAYKAQKRATTIRTLHKNQINMSKNNPTMAIFLGKNYLGQTDKQEIDANLNHSFGSVDTLAMENAILKIANKIKGNEE